MSDAEDSLVKYVENGFIEDEFGHTWRLQIMIPYTVDRETKEIKFPYKDFNGFYYTYLSVILTLNPDMSTERLDKLYQTAISILKPKISQKQLDFIFNKILELKLNGKLNPLIFYQRCKKHFIGLITR